MNLFNPCTLNLTMNSIGLPSPLLVKSIGAPKSFSSSFTCYCISSSSSSSSESEDKNNKERVSLSGIVNEQVEELLNREENKSLLDGLEKATLRVEMAKRQLALIQEQEVAAKQFRDYVNKLEGKASEIEECQREISQAKAMVEEAERAISEGELQDGEEIDRDEERLESVKAASISALIGTLSGLPICLTHVTDTTQLLLPLAINFISCALFGVTFRYTIRRNLDDVQLKTGVAAAFGVVKGLGTLGGGPFLELNFESFLSHALDGTILVSESLFIFICASVALDFCFKTRLLSTFPIDNSV